MPCLVVRCIFLSKNVYVIVTFAQITQQSYVYLHDYWAFSKKHIDNQEKFGIIIIVPVYNVFSVHGIVAE